MAAATLTYQAPSIYINEEFKSPNLRGYFTPASGHTTTAIIQPFDFVTESSGTIARVATNASGSILGLTRFGEQMIWGQAGGSTTSNVGPNQLFGYSQAGTLLPAEAYQVAVDSLSPGGTSTPTAGPLWVEMSLVNTVQWTGDSLIGTAVGLLRDDSGTGYFIADSTQSNKVGVIAAKVQGPNITLASGTVLGKGQINDYGVRVWVSFYQTALQ